MLDPPLVPELYCSDIDRSIAFYAQTLGFRVLFARPEERFAYLEREGAHLMLEGDGGRELLAAPLEHPRGRGVNLMIRATDVRSLYDAVIPSAAPLLLELEDRWYRRGDILVGNRQFVVQDPDGYLLRFYQDLGERPLPLGIVDEP